MGRYLDPYDRNRPGVMFKLGMRVTFYLSGAPKTGTIIRYAGLNYFLVLDADGNRYRCAAHTMKIGEADATG